MYIIPFLFFLLLLLTIFAMGDGDVSVNWLSSPACLCPFLGCDRGRLRFMCARSCKTSWKTTIERRDVCFHTDKISSLEHIHVHSMDDSTSRFFVCLFFSPYLPNPITSLLQFVSQTWRNFFYLFNPFFLNICVLSFCVFINSFGVALRGRN